MESNQRISEILVETGAYTDLDQPVILTSGALGIYYINTEKLCQDGGKFNEFGDSSSQMIDHAVKMMKEHPTFEEVIDILAEKPKEIIGDKEKVAAVSGGQRRDWLFSGPIAVKLGVPHISLYKKGHKEMLDIDKDGKLKGTKYDPVYMDGHYAVHIVDLITEASSCYSQEGKSGWIPMLRDGGVTIDNLLAVVTRQQGGEERLAEQGVHVTPFAAIDEEFLMTYSKDPERALAYQADPEKWSRNYLSEHGALALLPAFNPDGGKLDRAKKFLNRYRSVLCMSGGIHELDKAARDNYGRDLKELFGGEQK
jgi:hypothetical protein